MSNIKKIVYCSVEQYKTLVKEGKAIINGVEKLYEPETTMYITNAIISGYPVGSIYMSLDDTSPASIFGGTWEQINNAFLYASGTYKAGGVGGSNTIEIAEENLPATKLVVATNNTGETVQISQSNWSIDKNLNDGYSALVKQNELGELGYEAGLEGITDEYHYYEAPRPLETMPPFLTVNMWKRVA